MKRIIVTDKLLSLATMLAALFSLAMFSACSEKEEEPYLKSADNGTTITAEGNSWAGWSTTLQSNIDLSDLRTSSSASWCTARLSAMGNNYQLHISAEDNPTLSTRQAIVSVQSSSGSATVSFTVSQKAASPYISFKDGGSDVTIDSQAKAWERVLDSNIEFSKLSATSSEKWCTAKLESTGSGITLKLEAQENETIEERKAIITIKASTGAVNTSFVVTQQAATPSIVFVDGGEDQTVTPDGKNWTWEVSGNIAYSDMQASSDADWCTVELTQATYTKKISLSVKVAKNETVSERKAVVTVKSKRYDTSVSFTITQNAFEPILSLKEGETIESKPYWSTIAKWTFETNIDIKDIEVECDADWCTFSLYSNNNGISLYAKMEENKSSSVRVANIVVKSTKYDKAISIKMEHQTNPMLFFYWNNDDSYILSCDKSLTISKPIIKRNGNNLEVSYTLNENGYVTYFSMWSGSWDGTSGINGTDDTGKNYYNGYPYAYSNMMVYIDGKRVGTYGQGQMVTIGNSVKGEIIFVDFPQNATKFSARLQITSNTPNKTFDHDYIDFVNIPVE